MNRERLLFVAVLAILALWFFGLREQVHPVTKVGPKELKLKPLPVASAAYATRTLELPEDDREAFTLRTNEQPHPRPQLELPEERGLDNIWPPTSHCLSLMRLGKLRRPAKPPVEGEAAIELPPLDGATEEAGEAAEGEGAVAPAGPVPDRVDQWSSFNRLTSGRVRGLVVNGKLVREPKDQPKVGEVPEFHRLLIQVELDPQRAVQMGVRALRVKFDVGGEVTQDLPDEITGVRVAVSGKQKGWWDGAKAYAGLPDEGYERRISVGRRLLEQGRNADDKTLLEWSLHVLQEAREKVPSAAQAKLKEILQLMLEAANLLNRQEQVLSLGFEHLARFPQEDEVLLFIGNILASRSFGLLEQAAICYARASGSREAQRRRAALLVRLGRFGEARTLLEGGDAGGGAEVDLLLARAALAQADFETATSRAEAHTGGQDAAEAYQILGGAHYAQGKAEEAEQAFLSAVNADPRRSTAYSDLGLALAVQGRRADALLCFERAIELDFENSVVPKVGEAFLDLNGGDAGFEAADAAERPSQAEEHRTAAAALYERAAATLATLADNNPRDLLVRYYRAFVQERTGDLQGAATSYRSILDEDHRYRIAIARLGLVFSRHVLKRDGDEALVRPAVAHLGKAVDLNPDEPVLPYILARFLMDRDEQAPHADRLFQMAQDLPPPEYDKDLPLWARAGQSALAYRDENQEELAIKSRFNRVVDEVRDQITRSGETDIQRALDRHPVHQYAQRCLGEITENERKVDVTWFFRTKPRDWKFHRIEPMKVAVVRKKGIHFQGTVNYQGNPRDFEIPLKYCSVEYTAQKKLTGNTFYELVVVGEVPEGAEVDVGVGIIGGSPRRKEGRTGIQIRRKSRSGTAEVRLDGGESDLFRRLKARSYVDMSQVSWPTGKFTVRLALDDHDQGTFRLFLNDMNVFATQLGAEQETEKSSIFGRGRGSRPISIILWIEGNDGDRFANIYIDSVTLTRAGS